MFHWRSIFFCSWWENFFHFIFGQDIFLAYPEICICGLGVVLLKALRRMYYGCVICIFQDGNWGHAHCDVPHLIKMSCFCYPIIYHLAVIIWSTNTLTLANHSSQSFGPLCNSCMWWAPMSSTISHTTWWNNKWFQQWVKWIHFPPICLHYMAWIQGQQVKHIDITKH